MVTSQEAIEELAAHCKSRQLSANGVRKCVFEGASGSLGCFQGESEA